MEVRIPARDTAYILSEAELSTAVVNAFQSANPEGPLLVLELEPEAAADLLLGVLNASLRAMDRSGREAAERIAGRIRAQLERQGMEIAIERRGLISGDPSRDHEPQAQFGGLSPRQLETLLNGPWGPESPGVQIHATATAEQLARSYTLHNARVMLQALADQPAGIRATANGNLNRAFVREMLDATRWPAGEMDFLRRSPRQLNEHDVPAVSGLRVVLELDLLIELRGRRVHITEAGRELLRPADAALLQADLVETTFCSYNLAYRDGMIDLPEFQDTVAYAMLALARSEGRWLDMSDAEHELLLPSVAAAIPVNEYYDPAESLINLRLLRYLEELGLVECERREDRFPGLLRVARFRTTDLFAATVAIDLTSEQASDPPSDPPSDPERRRQQFRHESHLAGLLDDLDEDDQTVH